MHLSRNLGRNVASDVELDPQSAREILRRLVLLHGRLCVCILVQMIMCLVIVALGFIEGFFLDHLADIFLAVTAAIGLIGGTYLFLISWTVRNPFWAIVAALAAAVLVLSLYIHNENRSETLMFLITVVLSLMTVRDATTHVLQENGVKIGTSSLDLNAIIDGEDSGW